MTSRLDSGLTGHILSAYGATRSASLSNGEGSDSASATYDDYIKALSVSGQNGKRQSLVVQLPFCPVRCLDCNADAIITHDGREIDRYLDVAIKEIALLREHFGAPVPLQRLHLGGGSPNYLSERQLVRLMGAIDDAFVRDGETRCSLEANPRRCSPSQLTLLNNLGFDSVFFGLRELDPSVLLSLGRQASFHMVRDVFDVARDTGFNTIGTDILYGLPCQTNDGLDRTVEQLLQLAPDRIACNSFRRDAASRFHQTAIDSCRIPSLADKIAQFNRIVERLQGDYDWIGLDNFVRHGDTLSHAKAEGLLRKNWIGYSYLPSNDFYGVGLNAINDVDTVCAQNHRDLTTWREAVNAHRFPINGGIRLTDRARRYRDELRELVCNGQLDNCPQLAQEINDPSTGWNEMARGGFLDITADTIRLSDEGRCMLPHLLNLPVSCSAVIV
jgi:oxygen-independent coproporphyrinogen-3 oxidase